MAARGKEKRSQDLLKDKGLDRSVIEKVMVSTWIGYSKKSPTSKWLKKMIKSSSLIKTPTSRE